MAASVEPIYPNKPNISWTTVSAANTAKDGTGTVQTGFTAGANGSRVDTLKIKPLGGNVQTVLRLFINNGQPNSSPANNTFFKEISMPTTSLSESDAMTTHAASTIQFNGVDHEQLVLPAGYKINAVLGTAVAAGYQLSFIGGDY